MQRLVMCGKEERKGWLVSGLVFGGRADHRNRRFARNREAGFTCRFEKTEICP